MNKHAQALGKKGGESGRGAAKARTSEQARAAAESRWAKQRAKAFFEDVRKLWSPDFSLPNASSEPCPPPAKQSPKQHE